MTHLIASYALLLVDIVCALWALHEWYGIYKLLKGE